MRSFKQFIESKLSDQIEDAQGYNAIAQILDQNGVTYWKPRTLKPILVYDDNGLYVVDDFNSPWPKAADEWVWDQDPGDYVRCHDFNEEFWQSAHRSQFLYHGTTPEAWEGIQEAQAILPGDRTRGIGNRSTGSAIFLSETLEYVKQHYNGGIILGVNVAKMKQDGYMPHVSREGPIEEYECRGALAHAVGIEDFVQDEEAGIDHDTVVCFDKIPLKYVSQIS